MNKSIKKFFPRSSCLKVFVSEIENIRRPAIPLDVEIRALSAEDLITNAVDDASFRESQIIRLKRFGASHAYGVFLSGQLAHVSWLLLAQSMQKDVPRVLHGLADEAEISCCETLAKFRGLGIYPMMIAHLAEVAKSQGIRRLYMKTTSNNLASQAGIRKAGLVFAGTVFLVWLPGLKAPFVWPRRFTQVFPSAREA